VQRNPEGDAEHRHGGPAPGDRRIAQRQDRAEQAGSARQRHQVQSVRVDRRDHKQSDEVVDDHECQQPHAQTRGSTSHQREHA
jgi:hypothetical protein